MHSRTLEAPAFIALLATLALSYVAGYAIGVALTGSVIVALLLAFVLPCISMFGLMLIAPRLSRGGSDHAPTA
jgi:hypothetical protein